MGPFPTDPGRSTIDLPAPGQTPDAPDLGYSVLPNLLVPESPVVVQASPYFQYAVSKIWLKNSGLSLQVVQGLPGTPADVIRTSAPHGHVVLRWISRRRGAKPIIPSEDQGGLCPNEVFLSSQVTAAIPGHLTTGEQCWMVSGVYVYGLRVPYSESDVMVIGAFPYTDEIAADNALTPDMYSTDVAGPDLPPAGAPTDPIDF
jgi:hypothetical protein